MMTPPSQLEFKVLLYLLKQRKGYRAYGAQIATGTEIGLKPIYAILERLLQKKWIERHDDSMHYGGFYKLTQPGTILTEAWRIVHDADEHA